MSPTSKRGGPPAEYGGSLGLLIGLDGPPQCHDKNRVFADGRPTASTVFDTLVNLIAGTYHTFRIDITDPSDVKFYVDGARVLSSTTFDMSNFSGTVQPYLSVSKASGTGTGTLTVDWVKVTATRA